MPDIEKLAVIADLEKLAVIASYDGIKEGLKIAEEVVKLASREFRQRCAMDEKDFERHCKFVDMTLRGLGASRRAIDRRKSDFFDSDPIEIYKTNREVENV